MSGFTLVKSKSRGKIDAAIALSLAYDQAQRRATQSEFVSVTKRAACW